MMFRIAYICFGLFTLFAFTIGIYGLFDHIKNLPKWEHTEVAYCYVNGEKREHIVTSINSNNSRNSVNRIYISKWGTTIRNSWDEIEIEYSPGVQCEKVSHTVVLVEKN